LAESAGAHEILESLIAMAKQISESDPRMVHGIKQLLNDNVGLGMARTLRCGLKRAQEQAQSQLAARGFQAFPERKGIR